MYIHKPSDRAQARDEYIQNDILSFHSIFGHFPVDFVCKGVSKGFQYTFDNEDVILTLVAKDLESLTTK